MVLERRSFLGYALLFLGGALSLIIAWAVGRFSLFGTSREKKREFQGDVAARLQPGVPLHVPDAGAWLLKEEPQGEWRAVDDRCTHLGCTVKWHEQKQRFQCPCHGSEFDRTGNVMHGPATRPLSHLFISKESNRTVRLLEKPPEGSQKVP